MSFKLKLRTAALSFVLTLGVNSLASTAYAGSFDAFFGEQDGLFAISAQRDDTFLDVGVAYINRPTYVGSGETENQILPYARGDYKGRLFVNAATGAGVYWRNTDNIRVSTSVNWAVGRGDDETPFLGEQGEVDGSVTIVNAVRFYLPFAALDAISSIPVTGDYDGASLDTLLTTEFLPFEGLRITPGVRASFGTSGWINTLYGVEEDALAAANIVDIDPFEADSGLLALGVHAAAYYQLPNDFELIGIVNYSLLQDDAKDSPLSPDNDGFTVSLAIAKHF